MRLPMKDKLNVSYFVYFVRSQISQHKSQKDYLNCLFKIIETKVLTFFL